MQARFYAPWYGRFLSPDPARDQHFEETQSWNIYSYVRNNPTMRIDPTGMFTSDPGIVQDLKDFVSGFLYSFTNNMALGAPDAIRAANPSAPGPPDSRAANLGRVMGDVIGVEAGLVVGGGGAALEALGTPVTGGTSLAAIPATAAYGLGVITVSGVNGAKDMTSLMTGKPNAGSTTEPTLPAKTVVKEDGVKIDHYTKSGDHGPAHLHVKGGGPETKIGQNGKPIKGAPELTSQQQAVVSGNKGTIRRAVDKIQRWFRHNN